MNKKFVYQVGNNKKVILWCTANQISRFAFYLSLSWTSQLSLDVPVDVGILAIKLPCSVWRYKKHSVLKTPPNKYWQDGTDKHDATELTGSYPTDLPSSVTREHGHSVSTSVVPVTSFKFYLTSRSKFMFWSVILAGRCKKLDAKRLWCGGQLSEPSYAISVGDGTREGNNSPILVIGGVWRWTLTPL